MKKSFKQIIFYLVMIIAVIAICAAMFNEPTVDPIYTDIITAFENQDVVEATVNKSSVLELTFKEGSPSFEKWGKTLNYRLASYSVLHADIGDVILEQQKAGILKFEIESPSQYSNWLPLVSTFVTIGLFVLLYFFLSRQLTGAGGKGNKFAKSHAKLATNSDRDKVTFRDVAGADEEKAELEEVVEFLRDPSKYAKLGARIPHGVLLVGPPGTGKTLLAKAVAGEANVPFYSISGSDFVEMYVGLGASRVRDLFDTARKSSAAIIFIDEIDAVGRHRGAGLGGGHDEREQTLNQLLVEMDGFGSHDGIIVIAATNRPDILDPALLRPGRFDRQITVNYPDINGRVEILKVHSRKKPLEASVDLTEVARMTAGFTGADLANLLNEAALLASRKNKSLIGMDEISDAFIRIIAGPKKKARMMKESEKRNTAYHEAGHAIIAYELKLDPVQQISIIPSGRALGYTLNPPTEDKYSEYKSELKNQISMLLGGRAAEEIINGDVTGGASNDIDRATKIAKKMVTRLGMSDTLGPRSFGTDQGEVFLGRDFSSSQDYSEEIAAKIDSEIHDIITNAYSLTKDILRKDIEKLHFIAEFLLKNEIMDGDQFKAIMETADPTIEEIEAIAEAKKKKSEDDNLAAKQAEEARLAEEEAKRLAEEEAKKAEAEAVEPVPFENVNEEDGLPKNE